MPSFDKMSSNEVTLLRNGPVNALSKQHGFMFSRNDAKEDLASSPTCGSTSKAKQNGGLRYGRISLRQTEPTVTVKAQKRFVRKSVGLDDGKPVRDGCDDALRENNDMLWI